MKRSMNATFFACIFKNRILAQDIHSNISYTYYQLSTIQQTLIRKY